MAALFALGFSPWTIVRAQTVPQDAPVPLSRYVPADVGFFIRIPRLGEANAALRRTGAVPWLAFMTGGAAGTDTPAGLREAVTAFLGPKSSIDIDELMRSEIGIVSDGWSRLGGAVWLVRIKDGSVLDRWVPKEARLHDLQSRNGVRFIWTRDGMSLCVRGDVVALARRTGGGSLLKKVRSLMNGRRGESLDASESFQKLRGHLPARYLAILQITGNNKDKAGDSILSLLWPTLDRAAVALYERQGRLDIAVSGSLTTPRRQAAASAEAIDRLAQLPRTTLLALATTFDFAHAYTAAVQESQPGTLGRYLALMEGLGRRRSAASELFHLIGPDIIFVWGQDFGDGGQTPHFAVMLESEDARAVRAEVTYIAGSLLRMLGAIDPVQRAAAPAVKLEMHLGCPILSVPLGDYAGESRFPGARLLAEAEPSWAASGRWFIFALSRDHLRRILDAQDGLIPRLDSVREVQKLTRRRQTRMALSAIQAGMASDVLRGWLESSEESVWPLLDPFWGRQPHTPKGQPCGRLGIGLRTDTSARVVIIDRVIPGSPAEGRLQREDRIVGVDGSLLDLNSPAADLRRKLIQRSSRDGPTLRVRRGDSILDVTLPADDVTGLAELLVKPADALRELAALGSALEFVTVETRLSDETHVLARITLQFTAAEPAGR